MFPQTTFPRLLTLAAACLSCVAVWAQTRLVFTDVFPTGSPATMTPTTLSATGFATATAEAGEPAHDGTPARNSLWARFTANQSGLIRLSRSLDITQPLRVAVYTNESLPTLGRVASTTLVGETNELRWEVAAGVTYSLVFDATNRTPTIPAVSLHKFFVRSQPDRPLKIGEVVRLEAVSTDPTFPLDSVEFSERRARFSVDPFGPWTRLAASESFAWRTTVTNLSGGLLEIRAATPTATSLATPVYLRPPHDDLAEAAELPGAFSALSEQRSLGIGSVEPGEFLPRRNEWFGTPATIWWKWTPAFSVNFSVTSQNHGLWAAYDGDPLTNAPLGSGFNTLQFPAEAGRTYLLQMVVAGSPRFATNRIEFRQEVLALALPPGALRDDSIRTSTGREPAFVLPADVVEVGTTSLLPGETFSGFRLNGAEPDRVEAGLPIFRLAVAPEGATYQLSATNGAGLRVTSPRLFLASRPANDAPAFASQLQGSSGIVNGLLGTATSDEPAAVHDAGGKPRWWWLQVPGETTVDLDLRGANSVSLAGRLAVFPGRPGPATEPLAMVHGTAASLFVQFEALAAGPYFISADGDGLFALNISAIHPFRWKGLPVDIEAGGSEQLGLGASWDAGLVINHIEYEGRAEPYGGPPPVSFTLLPRKAGAQLIRVHYARGDGVASVLQRVIMVRPLGDTFERAENLRDDFGTGELTFATLQAGEPEPFGSSAGSVWHAWSPAPGEYRLSRSAGQQVSIAVFEGDQMSNLRLVGSLGPEQDAVVVRTLPDRPYRIRVSSALASTEGYGFNLDWIPVVEATLVQDPGVEPIVRLRYSTIVSKPYSVWSGDTPEGPWNLEIATTGGGGVTVFELAAHGNVNRFFRVTCP